MTLVPEDRLSPVGTERDWTDEDYLVQFSRLPDFSETWVPLHLLHPTQIDDHQEYEAAGALTVCLWPGESQLTILDGHHRYYFSKHKGDCLIKVKKWPQVY